MASELEYNPETSLTFPPPDPYHPPTVNPGPLLPLETPPPLSRADLPALPSPPRKPLLDQWYTLSTHLVPAAYPRTSPYVAIPKLPQWTPNKDEFKAAVRETAGDVLSIKGKQWEGAFDRLPRNAKPLWSCVNRYVRRDLRADGDRGVRTSITLLFAHANGFPKEVRQ